MKTTHLRERRGREGETGRRGRGRVRRVVSPRKWKFDDGSTQRRARAQRTLIMRVPHEREAKSTSLSNPLIKKSHRDLSRHADLKYRKSVKLLTAPVSTSERCHFDISLFVCHRAKHAAKKFVRARESRWIMITRLILRHYPLTSLINKSDIKVSSTFLVSFFRARSPSPPYFS